jgi:hypothetical protein
MQTPSPLSTFAFYIPSLFLRVVAVKTLIYLIQTKKSTSFSGAQRNEKMISAIFTGQKPLPLQIYTIPFVNWYPQGTDINHVCTSLVHPNPCIPVYSTDSRTNQHSPWLTRVTVTARAFALLFPNSRKTLLSVIGMKAVSDLWFYAWFFYLYRWIYLATLAGALVAQVCVSRRRIRPPYVLTPMLRIFPQLLC